MRTIEETAGRARELSRSCRIGTEEKNAVLLAVADALEEESGRILEANAADIEAGREKGLPENLIDRLMLSEERIHGIAEGVRQVAALPDPVGTCTREEVRPNGLCIRQMRTPIGVIAVIYEARPNVTADVFSLCFKTGNVTILRGGSDAERSNRAITEIIRETLLASHLPEDLVQLIEESGHASLQRLMKLRDDIDLLIPRGGAGLIRSVVENSTIPVIETGTGNCHVFVDAGADIPMAVRIIVNAKTQRNSVCNAMESLVVHEDAEEELLTALVPALAPYGVELRADEKALAYIPDGIPAAEEDWGTEYLGPVLSVKTVSSFDEAVRHINFYSTHHSESIVTKNEEHAERFLEEIDSAAVYVNASTRFTDGFEFGLGAEIGISTQKLHARGPMGLEALTSEKYVIRGEGQVRG